MPKWACRLCRLWRPYPPNFLGIFFGTPIATKMVPKHAHERRSVDPAARSKTAAMPRSRGRNGRISKFCCWGRCGLLKGPPSGTYTTMQCQPYWSCRPLMHPSTTRAPLYRSQRTHLRTFSRPRTSLEPPSAVVLQSGDLGGRPPPQFRRRSSLKTLQCTKTLSVAPYAHTPDRIFPSQEFLFGHARPTVSYISA